MTWEITWSLRHMDWWDSYSWSFKAFEWWKKSFLNAYLIDTWRRFKDDYPNSGDREAIYKRIFKMEGVDVFGNDNVNATQWRNIDETIIASCQRISDLLNTL